VGDHFGFIAAPRRQLARSHARGDVLVGPSLVSSHTETASGWSVEPSTRTIGRDVRRRHELEPDAIVWATGFRADYSWIDVRCSTNAAPTTPAWRNRRARAYFLGMHNQYSIGSALIHWVKDDAAYLVEQVGVAAITAPLARRALRPAHVQRWAVSRKAANRARQPRWRLRNAL